MRKSKAAEFVTAVMEDIDDSIKHKCYRFRLKQALKCNLVQRRLFMFQSEQPCGVLGEQFISPKVAQLP